MTNPRVHRARRDLEHARARRRRHGLLTALGGLLCLAASACKEPTGPVREISGERLFYQYCARCHGTDGRGLPDVAGVRDLTDPRYMGTLSDDQLRRTIQMGKPPNMPAFGRSFAEPSLRVLTAYVRKLSTDPRPVAAPPVGAPPAAAPPAAAPPTSPTTPDAPAGAAPDGSAPATDGATPGGAMPDGATPDGTTPDEATPPAAGASEAPAAGASEAPVAPVAPPATASPDGATPPADASGGS
ncbi:MAG: c-type cytochrome [Myxococcales bacterium]|nr:c-type cytochrome [Myxococcales bacterium]